METSGTDCATLLIKSNRFTDLQCFGKNTAMDVVRKRVIFFWKRYIEKTIVRRMNPNCPKDNKIVASSLCGSCYKTFDCLDDVQSDGRDKERDCFLMSCGHYCHR